MQALRTYFDRLVPLSDTDWDAFASKLVQVAFPKKSVILKAGHTEPYLSFVEEGILRYYTPGGGKETTFAFVFAGDFSSAYDSFLLRAPSVYTIEALTDASLWRISYADLQGIYSGTAAGERIGRRAAEALFLKKAGRELSLLNETAEQRYLALMDQQPQLLQHIPLKYLAAYIGITPQALSRIRARIS